MIDTDNGMQLDLFDMLYEDFKFDKNKPIRLIETFAGIGTQKMAFDRLGIDVDVIAIVEVDKHAVLSYAAMHTDYLEVRDTWFNDKDIAKDTMVKTLQNKMLGYDFKNDKHTINERNNIEIVRDYYLADLLSKNLGDISKVKGGDLPKGIDMLTYSFPCFPAGSLVMTDNGYKTIETIKVGDKVIGHDNLFHKVIRTMDNGRSETIKLKAMGTHEIITTKNHKFYARNRNDVYNPDSRNMDRSFNQPKWIRADELKRTDYLGVAINQNSIIPQLHESINHLSDNKHFWYLVGRYMGDGWVRDDLSVWIAGKDEKAITIASTLDNLGMDYGQYKEITTIKTRIVEKNLGLFLKQFGKGAINKRLNNVILDLPIHLLESFVDGYIDSDGSFTNNKFKTSSISEELSYGFAQCVAKVYHAPSSIYLDDRGGSAYIEGRKVNVNKAYQVSFKKEVKKQDKAFYEDGYIWYPFKEITNHETLQVYDIEVDGSHSYTVNNFIVHNCTDLSKAGQQKGLTDTRSGLVYQVFRIVEELKAINNQPKTLLMENVVDLIQKKFINEFHEMQVEVESYGYMNYTMRFNAKDFGVAQNRDRVFMLSIPRHHNYTEPKPFKLVKRLKDYLEDDVDEKYYLSDTFIRGMSTNSSDKYDRAARFETSVKTADDWDYSTAITTREGNVATSTFIKIPEATKQGYDLAYDGDSVNLEQLNSKTRRGRVGKEEANTLTTSCNQGVVVKNNNLRIRKLTPLECWRLMGIDDECFYKAQQVTSNSQLYKQAGNAIVVDVFANIVKNLI